MIMKTQTKTFRVFAETLTPVHIGSGNELHFNTDYIYFEKQNVIGVIQPEKILSLIGKDNLDKWVTYITQKKGIDKYLYNILKRNPEPDEISSRIIPVLERAPHQQNIKEQLFNGTGKPYIPGSSIKGSIRTALLTYLIGNQPEVVKQRKNLEIIKRHGRAEFNDSIIQKHYFGHDPNHDIMRLIRTGDVTLRKTSSYLVQTVNLQGNHWDIKKSINQFVECIPLGESSEFKLQIFDYGQLAKQYFPENKKFLTDDGLITRIRSHTNRWLNNEIAFWEEEGYPEAAKDYYQALRDIEEISRSCEENEAVLRIGFGGGFTSTTGDWQYDHMEEYDYNELTDRLRPRRYQGMVFPKTRKFTKNQLPLGFVKLRFNAIAS